MEIRTIPLLEPGDNLYFQKEFSVPCLKTIRLDKTRPLTDDTVSPPVVHMI